MKKFHEFLSKKRKGFTLIELMAVILMIGIVFGYGVVTIGQNTEKAKYARALEDISALATAVQLRVSEVGDQSASLVAANFTAASTYFDKRLDKPFSQFIDPWGTQYTMTFDADAKTVTIACSKATNPYSTPANASTSRVLNFSE